MISHFINSITASYSLIGYGIYKVENIQQLFVIASQL